MLSVKLWTVLMLLLFHSSFLLNASDWIIFPVVVTGPAGDGKEYETMIEFLTPSGSRTECWRAATNDDQPLFFFPSLTGGRSQACFANRRAFTSFDMNSLDRLQDGWLKIEVREPEEPTIVFLAARSEILLRDRNGKIESIASIPGMRPTKEFTLLWLQASPTEDQDEFRPAYAFVNPSSEETATITLTLKNDWTIREEFHFECQRVLELQPWHRTAQFWDELFPSCQPPGGFREAVIEVKSNIPIAAGAMKVFVPDFKFTSFPVYASEENTNSVDAP